MASKLITIIAGVGPGTGAAIARKFAAAYPVVLLARNPDNYNDIVKEINENGGKAIGVSTDVADPASVQNAIGQVEKEFGKEVGAAVGLTTKLSFCHRNILIILSRQPSLTQAVVL